MRSDSISLTATKLAEPVAPPSREPDASPYLSSIEHILAELERLDILIEAQVQRARQSQKQDDLQGLYISEHEVDLMLAQPIGLPRWATIPLSSSAPHVVSALEPLRRQIEARKTESARRNIPLRLVTLADQFLLSEFDIDVVLVCLAAELDLRYERLYAYLQDDVSKKRPTVDLALNLVCPSFATKLQGRERFSADAPLLRHHLLLLLEDSSCPKTPLLSRFLKLDDRITNYLLDSDELDVRLLHHSSLIVPQRSFDDLILASEVSGWLRQLLESCSEKPLRMNFYLQGPYGVGKRSIAEALGKIAGWKLLVVDGTQVLAAAGAEFASTIRLILREAMLQNAAVYWNGFDALLADEHSGSCKLLLRELEECRHTVFLAGETVWEPADVPGLPFVRVEFSPPHYANRVRFWQSALLDAEGVNSAVLAGRFRFTAGQIRDASATARNLARHRQPESPAPSLDELLQACRLQSNRKLASLATHIEPRYTFADIVLPAEKLRQLKEICKAVEYRSVVYDEWGFDAKLSLGKGISLLFSGPSGTGKTMAAEIIAKELGLDLYKIDLSTVVSKYIGETEKNLSRIFFEAETSNAILFFDEADALFGKRSEVRDAHDRYANIEINYLLQRIEEYSGVVILASNLRKNMDEAFVRRIHATVEFPFPRFEDRLLIWRNVWPASTPRENLDLDFMARRFELTGGNIRNIALAAAFLGAQDGGCVRMEHLIRSTWQEYQKMGKVIMEGEFGKYSNLIHVYS